MEALYIFYLFRLVCVQNKQNCTFWTQTRPILRKLLKFSTRLMGDSSIKLGVDRDQIQNWLIKKILTNG
ncbi:hypothetical protein BpHYR1_046732 [Brachionus plicatilis]|uniref:Uncharacterized protein n=1 Tax=Brachionus plicatilis TaxID=10195 RepID=A0A3M7Q7G2_BRAPC|nr:hypothetical protein BpHYR1_046732 [Brachionus plicatilis]